MKRMIVCDNPVFFVAKSLRYDLEGVTKRIENLRNGYFDVGCIARYYKNTHERLLIPKLKEKYDAKSKWQQSNSDNGGAGGGSV